jgi:hypothetical protein
MFPLNFLKRKKFIVLIVGVVFLSILIHQFFTFDYHYLLKFFKVNNRQSLVQTSNFPKSKFQLGTNLNGIAGWSTQLPFLDSFKSARKWITQCEKGSINCDGKWDTQEYQLLSLDAEGWVKSLPKLNTNSKYTFVETLVLLNSITKSEDQFLVLYEGEGTIEYGVQAIKDQIASKPGRDVIKIIAQPDEEISLKITSTDPKNNGNYIRNIHIIKASLESAYQKGEVFSPTFIEKINKFKVLRFMNWMGTNNSEQKEWSTRPLPGFYSYALTGVPIEIMVALSNQIKAEPWFNMPHLATDEYMTKFAQLVKERLEPNLKVYIEYSNEVWNSHFKQASWIEQQGNNEWNTKSSYTKQINWYAKRTAQMCDIWKGVFGNQQSRVVCILGGQASNPWTLAQALDCPLWEKKPCANHGIDAVAIAPYFGMDLGKKRNQEQVKNWTLDQLFQEINQGGLLSDEPGGSLAQAAQFMHKNFDLANQRKLKLIAYEGGQHLVGVGGVENNQAITKLFMAANRDPRMHDVYINYLNQWKNAGGGLFMHFLDIGQFSKWGSWGALEHVEQKKSPKYDALMEFIDKNY